MSTVIISNRLLFLLQMNRVTHNIGFRIIMSICNLDEQCFRPWEIWTSKSATVQSVKSFRNSHVYPKIEAMYKKQDRLRASRSPKQKGDIHCCSTKNTSFLWVVFFFKSVKVLDVAYQTLPRTQDTLQSSPDTLLHVDVPICILDLGPRPG